VSQVHIRVRAGGEHYALPVEHVLEAAELGEVTPVPGAAAEILGVRNLRGGVLPVIDLAALLGLSGGADPERILVAESGERLAGLAVESIVAVGELPGGGEATDSAYLSAAVLVEGELVGVVDLPAAFAALGGEATA
jgi:purine-binding chemotaxis protein CheW